MEEELEKVISNEELDGKAKIEAIQKLVSAVYVPAETVATERKTNKEKYESLKTEYDTFKASKMTEEEKAQALLEEKEQKYQDAIKKANKYSAQSIFASNGLTEEDYNDFLDDIVGLDEEKTKSLAEKICKTISNQKNSVASKIKDDIIKGATPPPAGNDTKVTGQTEVEKYRRLLNEAVKNNDMNNMVYYTRLLEEASEKQK